MKKLSAIFFASLLFFNWYGYRLLIAFWQQRADHTLELRLDRNEYDESSLVSVRLPVKTLSYYQPTTEFERVDGEITVGSITYKYVKRRFFNDSAELFCIPDTARSKFRKTLGEFFKRENNLGHFPNSKSFVSSPNQKYYSPTPLHFPLRIPCAAERVSTEWLVQSLQAGYKQESEKPPSFQAILV